MDTRGPDQIGRFDDFGGRIAYPPKGWVMTADGWKQIQRPPWSVRNEYPTAYPYRGPVLGSPLSGPAAAALTTANQPRIAVTERPEAVETRTHRVVADNPAERFARLDAEIAAYRLERKGRLGRRLSVVALFPPSMVIAALLSVCSVLHMVVVGLTTGDVRATVRGGLVDLGVAWSGLFEMFAEHWAR